MGLVDKLLTSRQRLLQVVSWLSQNSYFVFIHSGHFIVHPTVQNNSMKNKQKLKLCKEINS